MQSEIKRRIATYLLLLAGAMLIAHTLVPHHHHNKVAVAVMHLHLHGHTLFAHTHRHATTADGTVSEAMTAQGHTTPDGTVDHSHHDAASHSHNGEAEDCLISEVCAGAVLKVSVPDTEAPLLPVTILPTFIVDTFSSYLCAVLPLLIDDPPPDYHKYYIPYILHAYTARIARAVVLRAPTLC